MKLVCLWSSGAVLASDTRSGRAGGEGGHTLTRRVVFKIQTPSFFELKHFRERMGNQKQKWTAEEEEALLGGVAKHGPGKWKNILKDPDFAPFLTHRSNIDLKDKWRNLSVSTTGQGSKEKSRAPKIKAITAAPIPNVQNSAPAAPLRRNASPDTVMDDAPNSTQEGKNAPRYNAMIFEVLSTTKDTNGCDIGAIVHYIEVRWRPSYCFTASVLSSALLQEKYSVFFMESRVELLPSVEQRLEVPQHFRRLLSSKLRRLVAQGKLEKVQNCYRIRKDTLLGTKTPTPKQKDVRPRHSLSSGLMTSETVDDAANAAAYRVADAENKAYMAAEAVKEAERISKMAEDTDSMLQLVKEIYERCSRGEIVLLA
uniref:MYB transcription factor n=1 Tax=Fagus sylvatica TaxID=28930 RepID=A0A2N9H5U0_FAGSY